MANTYGFRVLVSYFEGRADEAALDRALQKAWISQVEYDRALAGDPPEGYIAPMRVAAAD